MGAVLFLFFVATFNSTYITTHAATTWIDTAVFMIFLVGAVFCFICSATFHMVTCHSQEVSRISFVDKFGALHASSQVSSYCHSFDYAGIITLTVGSFFPCIYYGFFCEPRLQAAYLIAMTSAGLGQCGYNGYEAMDTAQYRIHRCCIHCLES